MRSPALAVLFRKFAAHGLARRGPQPPKLGRLDPDRDARAQQDGRTQEDGYGTVWHLEIVQSGRLRRRQMVKLRKVGRQQVPLWRKVLLP